MKKAVHWEYHSWVASSSSFSPSGKKLSVLIYFHSGVTVVLESLRSNLIKASLSCLRRLFFA